MTKELSVQRELNYAFCHAVTVNLMHTELRINNLSKAADALLSTLARQNYMEVFNMEDTTNSCEDCKPSRQTDQNISNHRKYQGLRPINS